MLRHEQHLQLFSQSSVTEFFRRLGADHVRFEPAIFAHYDMFLVASRVPIVDLPKDDNAVVLASSPGSRLVQALLDLARPGIGTPAAAHGLRIGSGCALRLPALVDTELSSSASESDRAARLSIQRRSVRLADRAEAELATSESDRACAPRGDPAAGRRAGPHSRYRGGLSVV